MHVIFVVHVISLLNGIGLHNKIWESQAWWIMLIIPALGSLRQADLCELRLARATS